MIRILLVTSWETSCGVAEYAHYLKAGLEQTGEVEITVESNLHPGAVMQGLRGRYDLLVLNYHAALLSPWHPEHIEAVRKHGIPVVVIYHDSGLPSTEQCQSLYWAANRMIVHEPGTLDLPEVVYIRQGIPDWELPWQYDQDKRTGWSGGRPILGTIGFPYGWKNYDKLAEITAQVGWALMLIAPTATLDQTRAWSAINPYTGVQTTFLTRESAIAMLAGCDATAFLYVCNNAGTSGAIRMGVAARKPVIALSSCRQFRDLHEDPLGHEVIRWCATFDQAEERLRKVPIGRVDPGIVALAEQDSWTRIARKHLAVYQEILR